MMYNLTQLCKKCGKHTPSKTRFMCDECLPVASKAALTEEVRNKKSESRKGIIFSDEHRANIAKSRLGKTGNKWSEERKRTMSARFKGIPLSEEHKRKLSEAKKGKPPVNKGIPVPEHVRAKISAKLKGRQLPEATKAKMRGRKLSEERKRKLSESATRLIANGIIGYQSRGKRPVYTTKTGEVIKFRSSWEHKVAMYFDAENVVWEYEFMMLTLDGGESYLPDFFIFNDNGELSHIIEVKGWFSEKGERKFVKFWKWLVNQDVPLELWD